MADRHFFVAHLENAEATWENYYEIAWTVRARIVEEILAGGETSLARVLALMAAHEKRFTLRLSGAEGRYDGHAELVPKEAAAPALFTTDNRGISQGALVPVAPLCGFDKQEGLLDFCHGVDAVAELGSGYGAQLLKLYLAGGPRGAAYLAAESSAAGRGLCERLGALEPGLRLSVVDFNFHRPDLSFLEGQRRILLFTSWAIHMCDAFAADFFERVAALEAEVTMVFFEPIGFQIPPLNALSEQQMRFLDRRYNLSFIDVLGDAERRGLVEILHVGKDVFSPTLNLLGLVSVIAARSRSKSA